MTASTPTVELAARPVSSDTGTVRRVRTDIQGLRALAVGMVVLYHLWPNSLTGGFVGVDVFFVISGFLITSHILSRPPSTGRDLALFWLRRVRRLLPVSLLVLAVTAVATRLVAPASRWEDTAHEIMASALYVQNWVLASGAVDYLAAEHAASPVQHFWSLSLEEQFYFVWPLLFLGSAWVSRLRGWDARLVAAFVVLGLFAISFAYSVYATGVSPSAAYFVTPTRIWELAFGGIVALWVTYKGHRQGHDKSAAVISWLGLACILTSGILFTGETPFPGFAAILPVAGTAAVIWADSRHKLSPDIFFNRRPVQFLGGLSYSVYLWHWPLIVLLPYISGGTLGRLDFGAILVSTVFLSWLSKRYVEDRFRTVPAKPLLRMAFMPAAAGMFVVVGLGAAQIAEVQHRQEMVQNQLAQLSAEDNNCFGAASFAPLSDCSKNPDGPVIPAPEFASDDKSDLYADDCWSNEPVFDTKTCKYGSGSVKIALVGNSHAGHWLPALQSLAEDRDWSITTYLASACNATDAKLRFSTPAASAACKKWGEWALQETSGDQYDLVITSERVARPAEGEPGSAQAGYESYLRKWAAAGTEVLILKDTPNPGATVGDVPDCLSTHGTDYAACSGTADEWKQPDPLTDAAVQLRLPTVATKNLDHFFCHNGRCQSVIGNVVVYFDAHHMTATYSRTLAPYLRDAVESSLPQD